MKCNAILHVGGRRYPVSNVEFKFSGVVPDFDGFERDPAMMRAEFTLDPISVSRDMADQIIYGRNGWFAA